MVLFRGKQYKTLEHKLMFRGKRVKAVYYRGKQYYPADSGNGFQIAVTGTLKAYLQGTDIYVHCGDGTVLGPYTITDPGNYRLINYAYSDGETYTATITGTITFLCLNTDYFSSNANPGLLEILTPVPASVTAFYCRYCTALTHLPENLFSQSTGLTAVQFSGSGLASIPAGLFSNCTALTDFYECFSACTALTHLPETLFAANTNTTYFEYTFEGCTGLTAIPAGLFDSCPNVAAFTGCFQGDSALTGAAPALWERSNVTSKRYCFRGCTRLSNYASIPSTWK